VAKGHDDDLLRLALEAAARERGHTTADVDALEPRHLEQARVVFEAREAARRRRFQGVLGLLALLGTGAACLLIYEMGTPVPVVTRAGFTAAATPGAAPLATSFARAATADGLAVAIEIEDLLADASFVLDATWTSPDGKEAGFCSRSLQHAREPRLLLACRPPLSGPFAAGTWRVQVLLSHPRLYQMAVPIPGSKEPGVLKLTITP
jgi:hypothetical protein